jgi:tRNA modification GTPase
LRVFRDAAGDILDEGLAILFPGPFSFTGEDVVELHSHGSVAVAHAIVEAAIAAGARPAEPGEFTRRALLSGRLDLAEAEGLADLIDAETAAQRKQALGLFGGRLSRLAEGWRERLIDAAAPLEAGVDFPDEADVPALIEASAVPAIRVLRAELEEFRSTAALARSIREGVRIAIVGAPNAGKSSLLNRLAGDDRAIVSDTPGTTRDVLAVRLDLGGVLTTLFDTAGIRTDSSDAIEQEGMRRARMVAETADIRILVVDVSRETSEPTDMIKSQPGDLVVANKADLGGAIALEADHRISALTGEGVDALVADLTRKTQAAMGDGDLPVAHARHADAVSRAIAALDRAEKMAARQPELAAEDMRLAARALGEITGAVRTEDLLDRIFSRFCIGK